MRNSTIILTMLGITAAWGQTRISVTVPAKQAWTRTGVFVDPGTTLVIEATGSIEGIPAGDNRPQFHNVPPDGRPQRQENTPQPTMRVMVMLGRIGNGPVFEAGARSEHTAQNAGELQLGINDSYLEDNTGSWNATITVRTSTRSEQRGRTQANPSAAGNSGRSQNDAYRGSAQNDGVRATPQYSREQGQRDTSNRDPDRDRSQDQYRPDYRASDYYRRYGHGFGIDEAVRVCEQSVRTQAARRFRTTAIHFDRTSIDDRPGRNDWVTGTLDIHPGTRQERYGFSCAVNFDTGQVRSAELDTRPLPDDPRSR